MMASSTPQKSVDASFFFDELTVQTAIKNSMSWFRIGFTVFSRLVMVTAKKLFPLFSFK